jgi:23S rRNA pseudouridine1911/1915/1917 synthase
MIRWQAKPSDAGRADRAVQRRFPGATRRVLSDLFARGRVRVDGARARKGTTVHVGATIELSEKPARAEPQAPVAVPELPLALLYQDRFLLAANKAAGTPSHPLKPHETGTLANALVARFPECRSIGDDPREAGLVHRLDTDTTGVIIAARTAPAWRALRAAFSSGQVHKQYQALVEGAVTEPGSCTAPIRGQSAHTSWTVERPLGRFTLLRCTATTGRMHQVRIHLAAAGTPIVGDRRYGATLAPPGPLLGHFLHAAEVSLAHPVSGEPLSIRGPLPADRAALLDQLA